MFQLLNDLFLKMTWLDAFISWLFKDIFGLDESHVLFPGLTFFFYDVIKIILLLSVLVYISSYIQAGFTPEKTQAILSKFKGIKGHIMGALLGTLTPFCSCSSIPIFIGFTKAGLPLGVTFSFLISSPLVDLASILLLTSIFGIHVAFIYVVLGLLISILGGSIIEKLYTKQDIESFVYETPLQHISSEETFTFKKRHQFSIDQVKEILHKVWLYIIIGVGIGAVIHGYIPETFIQKIFSGNKIIDVFIGVFAGAPIYADVFGTIPIAEALVFKGVGIGTVLAFMMSVTTLSIPSIVLLKQVVKKNLLLGFIAMTLTGIILSGFVFNILF